jgi:hypothetical protein
LNLFEPDIQIARQIAKCIVDYVQSERLANVVDGGRIAAAAMTGDGDPERS